MTITDIKTRGANTFITTDTGKSFVLNHTTIPLVMGMSLEEDGELYRLTNPEYGIDVSFSARPLGDTIVELVEKES